ncbi:MAG: elongation factor P 5-aminopentanone reductase [Bacillaceae bacterium]
MKYALIIGASGGIGLETAILLQREGYGLYLHYHSNDKKLKETFDGKDHVFFVQGNLSCVNEVEKVIQQIHHPIECIIYTPGISKVGLVFDFTEADIDELMNLHQKSLYILVNQLLPEMIRNKRGNIVVVSSIWGQVGASCEVLYSMTKGAQIAYVKALAKEVAPSGIRVNGIAPGVVKTNMLGMFQEEEIQQLEEEIPIGRVGEPSEIADVISFLLSDKASYMTGTIVSVNGGWYT